MRSKLPLLTKPGTPPTESLGTRLLLLLLTLLLIKYQQEYRGRLRVRTYGIAGHVHA